MNSIFLTTVPTSKHKPTPPNIKAQTLIESLKASCQKIAHSQKKQVLQITQKLGLDRIIFKIVKQFTKQLSIDRNQPDLIQKLRRKLILVSVLERQLDLVKQNKNIHNNHNYLATQPKKTQNNNNKSQQNIIKYEAIQQINHRVYLDQLKENRELKKKQNLSHFKITRLASTNKHKKEIALREKQKQKQEYEKIIQKRKLMEPKNYRSFWNADRQIGKIDCRVNTSVTKFRELQHSETMQMANQTLQFKDTINLEPTKIGYNRLACKSSEPQRNQIRARKEELENQVQTEHINKIIMKLMKITNLKQKSQELKQKQKSCHLQKKEREQKYSAQYQLKIQKNIEEKCEKKKNILKEISNKIHERMQKKENKVCMMKKQQEHQKLQNLQHLNNSQQTDKFLQDKKLQRQGFISEYLIKNYHRQAISRDKKEQQIINLIHLSDLSLQKKILGTKKQGKVQ